VGLSPEAVFIVSLLALAVAVMLAAAVSLRTLRPPAIKEHVAEATTGVGVPVKIICPTTTLPTRVELTRRAGMDDGLLVLACEFFGEEVPSCNQACVTMKVPTVSA